MFSMGSEVFFTATTMLFSVIVMSLSADLISLTSPVFTYKVLRCTCTRYFPALYAHGRYHVRVNELGC